ncbi:DNA repair protein RadC [Actimicrobium sp. CCC2.4]|uniref:RadC family protein n=1 Tax=Actimicrobium sp. CCC2.4 TaxID=3048606 RepID=UPI002AC8C0A0|nr:DNA repair protein RadC [Actimicrobium sp. CCC2.4]MEB0134976.1 DNA repair protein RadC [Actimicrobium sp. CCC2.4]WPX31975.1 DNA repair protein RadC [Actimicrobium sp. CCC2.4]
MSISDWPEHQRPRERLILHGAAALSDAELLAVFLRIGVAGKSAVDLAREMVSHFGSLNGLFAATVGQFSALRGLGPAKFAQLQAVMELARRAMAEQLKTGAAMSSPQVVRQYLQLALAHKKYESFTVLFVDVANRLIASEEMFRGTLTHASVYPREIVKAALLHNAAAILLAHNHPSGIAEPSQSDRALTQTLKNALAMIDVKVTDHLIVAGNQVYSFAEHGML